MTDRLLICNNSNEGCLQSFDWKSYDRQIHLCLTCKNRVADSYGVEKEQVSYVLMMLGNLKHYENKMPGLDKLGKREAVRMLLLANKIQVISPTEKELRGGERLGRVL
jgi:hypothetical protein